MSTDKYAANKDMDTILLGINAIAYVQALVSADDARKILEILDYGLDMKPVAKRIGAGGAESDEWFLAASGIVSSTARLSETLRLRHYPSLELTTRFYEGEDHYTVVPRVIGEGIRQLWKKEAADLGSSWPSRPPN